MANPVESTTFEAFVNAPDGRPFVQMTCSLGDKPVFSIKMSPDVVTALGLRAIQSAIEAERDAGFIKFLRDRLQVEDQFVGVVLSGMREHRQQFDAEAGTMRPLSGDDPSDLRK